MLLAVVLDCKVPEGESVVFTGHGQNRIGMGLELDRGNGPRMPHDVSHRGVLLHVTKVPHFERMVITSTRQKVRVVLIPVHHIHIRGMGLNNTQGGLFLVIDPEIG